MESLLVVHFAMPLVTATAPQPPIVDVPSWKFTAPPAPGTVAVKVTGWFFFTVYADESIPKLVGNDDTAFTVCVIGPATPAP